MNLKILVYGNITKFDMILNMILIMLRPHLGHTPTKGWLDYQSQHSGYNAISHISITAMNINTTIFLTNKRLSLTNTFNAQQIEKATACGFTYNIEAERCDNEESMTQYQKEFMAAGSLG